LAFLFLPQVDKEAIRETFFANAAGFEHPLNFHDQGDFIVNENQAFEIGGNNKTRKQLGNTPGSFPALDDIEYNSGNTIPLWLFGFLY